VGNSLNSANDKAHNVERAKNKEKILPQRPQRWSQSSQRREFILFIFTDSSTKKRKGCKEKQLI